MANMKKEYELYIQLGTGESVLYKFDNPDFNKDKPESARNLRQTTKTYLMTIDQFTTKYLGPSDLLSQMNKQMKLEEPVQMVGIRKTGADFPDLSIVYQNQTLLNQFLQENKDATFVNRSSFFIQFYLTFLDKLNTPHYFQYLIEKRYVNSYLEVCLKYHIYQKIGHHEFVRKYGEPFFKLMKFSKFYKGISSSENKITEENLLEQIRRYKVIRGLTLGSLRYFKEFEEEKQVGEERGKLPSVKLNDEGEIHEQIEAYNLGIDNLYGFAELGLDELEQLQYQGILEGSPMDGLGPVKTYQRFGGYRS